jgi:UDP-2,3-diacylglucosamine hydrolase
LARLHCAPRALFLADLHLEAEANDRHRAFIAYLEDLLRLRPLPALFILGDLFNYWAGPASEGRTGHRVILDALNRAAGEGMWVTLVHGNRDFLIDGRVCRHARFRVAPLSIGLRLGERRVLACHGDQLLASDRAHQRFRCVIRSFWVRALALGLPTAVVQAAAERLRRTTTRRTRAKPRPSFEIPAAAAARCLRGGYDAIICGHIHSAACLRLRHDGRDSALYSLGAWESEASVLEYGGQGLRFVSFPIAGRCSEPRAVGGSEEGS